MYTLALVSKICANIQWNRRVTNVHISFENVILMCTMENRCLVGLIIHIVSKM